MRGGGSVTTTIKVVSVNKDGVTLEAPDLEQKVVTLRPGDNFVLTLSWNLNDADRRY